MAITPLKLIRNCKNLVFQKIPHKFCMIGTKTLKISGQIAEKKELDVGSPPLKMGQNSLQQI